MLTLWRRHTPKCPHRNKGRDYTKCSCPLWTDGELHGKRYRQSIGTRDRARAERKLAALESPDALRPKELDDAVQAFLREYNYLEPSTLRKYSNVLRQLCTFAKREGVCAVAELSLEHLDSYRASRPLAKTTDAKETQLLRQFFAFCLERKWVAENHAKKIKLPKNIKPEQVTPYTAEEITAMITACDHIGRGPYERLRARAMVLLLRHTGLRVSDVARLARDRVAGGLVVLNTQKTGGLVRLPVHTELAFAIEVLPEPRGAQGRSKVSFR